MANLRLMLALSLALLLLSRPACRLVSAQDDDEFQDPEDDLPGDGEEFPEGDDYGEEGGYPDAESEIPEGDDGDVIALNSDTLAEKVASEKPFLVEFYAPWCGHCKSLAPEFKAAAAVLKEFDVLLAKIDATKHEATAGEYGVEGYPSLLWVVGKTIKQYNGGRTRDEIVTWVKKRIGFAVTTVKDEAEAKKILEDNDAIAAGYFKDFKGPEAAAFGESGRDADSIDYFQTDSEAVAKALGLPTGKAAAVAVVKKDDDKFVAFDGEYSAADITQFVMANRLPLFVSFSDEAAGHIFGGSIKKMIFLFFPHELYQAKVQDYAPVAREFKGKLIFIYVNSSDNAMDNVRDFFGVTTEQTVALGFSTENREDGEKFSLGGTLDAGSLKTFASDILAGTAKPFFKSEPAPEKNDGPVTIVVGDNFNDVVLNSTKDVLLEVYAPWCGHCKALEPTYEKLGEKFADISSVVIAKMDGTANEHPDVKVEGFPTLLFFPGNDKRNPLSVDADRKLIALANYIKEHASVAFDAPTIREDEQPAEPEPEEPEGDVEDEEGEIMDAEMMDEGGADEDADETRKDEL